MKQKTAFGFLTLPMRTTKPRNQGKTMVLDLGLGVNAAKDLVQLSEYIDIIKLGWGTPIVCSSTLLDKKIDLYKKHQIEVCSGGTLLEIAITQGKVEPFFRQAKTLGLTSIEISNGIIDLTLTQRQDLIRQTIERGFKAYGEIGSKTKSLTIDMSHTWLEEAKNDLKAGVDKVIFEGRASGTRGIYDDEGQIMDTLIEPIIEELSIEKILFEAPQKKQQTYLILKYGPEVNLGNIRPIDVIPLETLRRGIRGDTFGKIPQDKSIFICGEGVTTVFYCPQCGTPYVDMKDAINCKILS